MSAKALEGVRVLEFTGFAAGPLAAKYLGNFGATVVRVESRSRPDGFRTHYPPFTDNVPGLDRSGTFAIFNDSKYGVTVNLKEPRGVELAKRLAAWADIVIENFTPGTISRMGLGYEELRKVKENIIMLSTCNQGQTGPHAKHPGFGSHLSSLSCFTNLAGYPDRSPVLLYGPYIDFIGTGYAVIALMAALDFRRRTGKGQYIDVAQYENGLQFVAGALLDYTVNGRVAERMADKSPYAAPHGAYPCQGEDRWCAISVHSDAEWSRLVKAMGSPAWAVDPRYETLSGRKAHEAELDGNLADWTAGFQRDDLVRLLQRAEVHAAPVNDVRDLFYDPQFLHRRVWWEKQHPAMGTIPYEAPPFKLSETPVEITSPSPCLGQHNELVFKGILGMSEQEYAELASEGVIE